MKRKLFIFSLIFVLLLAGCDQSLGDIVGAPSPNGLVGEDEPDESTGYELEDNATKLMEDHTYYNDYLGVSITVPAGFWLYEADPDNFTEQQGLTGSYGQLSPQSYGTGEYLMLIDYANLQYSNRDNHVSFFVFGERVDGVTDLASYMEQDEEYRLEPEEGIEYSIIESESFTLGDTEGAYRVYECKYTDDDYRYFLSTYVFPVGGDFYLTVQSSYYEWFSGAADLIKEQLTENYVIVQGDAA